VQEESAAKALEDHWEQWHGDYLTPTMLRARGGQLEQTGEIGR
jgi:hypothetical protein